MLDLLSCPVYLKRARRRSASSFQMFWVTKPQESRGETVTWTLFPESWRV